MSDKQKAGTDSKRKALGNSIAMERGFLSSGAYTSSERPKIESRIKDDERRYDNWGKTSAKRPAKRASKRATKRGGR